MTVLQVLYASAPVDEMQIFTIEVQVPSLDPIRIAHGFKDRMLGVDGDMVLFEQGSLSITLPKRDTTGQQNLQFGVSNANGRIQQYIDKTLEEGSPAKIIYRTYLESDLTTPAERPLVMDIRGGSMQGGNAMIEASFYDMLNIAWPRQIYTQNNAPGIKYLA